MSKALATENTAGICHDDRAIIKLYNTVSANLCQRRFLFGVSIFFPKSWVSSTYNHSVFPFLFFNALLPSFLILVVNIHLLFSTVIICVRVYILLLIYFHKLFKNQLNVFFCNVEFQSNSIFKIIYDKLVVIDY